MFKISIQSNINFQQNHKKENKTKDVGVQYSFDFSVDDKSIETNSKKDQICQVSSEEKKFINKKCQFNLEDLKKFLKIASELTISEIKKSIIFDENKKSLVSIEQELNEKISCQFYYSNKNDQESFETNLISTNTKKKLNVFCTIWSCNNNQLIIVYNVNNDNEKDFFEKNIKSKVIFFNLYQLKDKIPNPLKPIFEISLKHEITQAISHPKSYSQIVIGSKTGAILILDKEIKKDDASKRNFILHKSSINHKLKITSLVFKNNLDEHTKEEKFDQLLSSSLDGKIIWWKINQSQEYLEVLKVFSLNLNNLFQQVEPGINFLVFCEKKENLIIVCESFIFSINLNRKLLLDQVKKKKLSVDFDYEPHKGRIKSLEINKFNFDLFLTYGEDMEIRLYKQKNRKPLYFLLFETSFLSYKWLPDNFSILGLNNDKKNILNIYKFYNDDDKVLSNKLSYLLKEPYEYLNINNTKQLALVNQNEEIFLFDFKIIFDNE